MLLEQLFPLSASTSFDHSSSQSERQMIEAGYPPVGGQGSITEVSLALVPGLVLDLQLREGLLWRVGSHPDQLCQGSIPVSRARAGQRNTGIAQSTALTSHRRPTMSLLRQRRDQEGYEAALTPHLREFLGHQK